MLKPNNLPKRGFFAKPISPLLREREKRFVKAVNGVFEAPWRQKIFKDQFYKHYENLDRWVAHSNEKIVIKLVEPVINHFTCASVYDFPCDHFAGEKGVPLECLCLEFCSLSVHPEVDFHSLKSFDFKEVLVSDLDIADLLCICSTIELLSLRKCPALTELKISNCQCHCQCHLKHLNVDSYYGMRSIEIYIPQLSPLFSTEDAKYNLCLVKLLP